MTNGGLKKFINEPTEPVVVLRLVQKWTKKKIDLLELVTLRDSGLSYREISATTGVSTTRLFRVLKS